MLIGVIDDRQRKRNEKQEEVHQENSLPEFLSTFPLALDQPLNGLTSVKFDIIVDNFLA
jgi:hypothetical protein